MKRYKPFVPSYSCNANFEEDTDGKWVEHEDVIILEAENTRLKEALSKIHNYIANPEHHDTLKHILDIDKMVLSALYGGEGE